MRPTADNRPNARAPRRGAFLTSNEESPTSLGTTTTNRRVPGLVHDAGQIPLFSSLGRARAASFPPDPQVANASPNTWVVANAVRPSSSPSQDIDRNQPAQVGFDAAPSTPIDAADLACPRATSLLLMMEGHERPERDTCPICKLKIYFDLGAHSRLYACCMERLCTGCTLEAFLQGTKHNCPNCNAALSKDNSSVLAVLRAHAEKGNAAAIYHLGQKYYHGDLGLQVDAPRAIKLWGEAAELGDADAHYDLGFVHYHGAGGLDKDEGKGIHHWQQAAMKGQAEGRHALGLVEFERSDYKLAFEHWTISAGMGYEKSSQAIRCAFELGEGTVEQRAKALGGFQDAMGKMESHQRTTAKLFHSISSLDSQL